MAFEISTSKIPYYIVRSTYTQKYLRLEIQVGLELVDAGQDLVEGALLARGGRLQLHQLLGMRLPLVRPAVAAVRKGLAAEGAGVRPQSRVDHQVRLQRLCALVLLSAVLALELLHLRVHHHVHRQRALRVELQAAQGTDVRRVRVRVLVDAQPLLVLERLRAVAALHRTVIRVQDQVLLQTALRCASLAAFAAHVTLYGRRSSRVALPLHPVVDHVPLQTVRRRPHLATLHATGPGGDWRTREGRLI